MSVELAKKIAKICADRAVIDLEGDLNLVAFHDSMIVLQDGRGWTDGAHVKALSNVFMLARTAAEQHEELIDQAELSSDLEINLNCSVDLALDGEMVPENCELAAACYRLMYPGEWSDHYFADLVVFFDYLAGVTEMFVES